MPQSAKTKPLTMEKGSKSSNTPNNPTFSARPLAEAELENLAPLQYEPLPKASSIRLLKILPSSTASNIHCSLVTADLEDDALVFDALSYTWGNPVTIHERLNHVSAMSQLGELVDKVKAAKLSAAAAGRPTQMRPKPLVDLDAFTYRLNHPLQPYEHVDWNIERTHPIQCNGCRVMVTKNLFEALKILRRFHYSEVLGSDGFEKITGNPIAQNIWIDMICINQDDVSERNRQVSVMGRIFSQAQTVIGWLGPEEAQSRLAVVALRALFREFVEVRKPPDELLPTALYAFKDVDVVSTVALFAFMQRLWFRRAWIVQEIVLAKRLVLVCGGVILRWEMLELVVYHIQKSGLLPPLQHFVTGLITGTPTQRHLRQYAKSGRPVVCFPPSDTAQNKILEVDPRTCIDFMMGISCLRITSGRDAFRSVPLMDLHKNALEILDMEIDASIPPKVVSKKAVFMLALGKPSDITLSFLLYLFRRCDASDPRDKIFSLLGILERDGSRPLDIPRDYALPVADIYRLTVESIIRSSNNLEILSLVQDPSQTKIQDLPSWVPDFSVGKLPLPFGFPGQQNYTAGVPINPGCITCVAGTLQVHGYFVDAVRSVAATRGCYFVRTAPIIAELPLLYHPGAPASSQAPTRIEAYWRTLIGDAHNGPPALLYDGFAFADWITGKLVRKTYESGISGAAPSKEEMAKVAQKYFWWGALSSGEQGEFVSLTKNNEKESANAEIAEHRSLRETKISMDPYQRPIRFLPDKAYLSSFVKKTETVSPVHGSTTYSFEVRGPDNRRLRNFKKRLAEVKEGHRMFRTENNYLGLGPLSTSEDDEVWVVEGAKVPLLLRRVEKGRYRFVGEAYVHGIMQGEVVEGDRKPVGFVLV